MEPLSETQPLDPVESGGDLAVVDGATQRPSGSLHSHSATRTRFPQLGSAVTGHRTAGRSAARIVGQPGRSEGDLIPPRF